MNIRTFSGADQIDVFDKAEYKVASGLSMGEYQKRQEYVIKKMKELEEQSIRQPYFGPGEKRTKLQLKKKGIKDYLFFGILFLVVFGFLYLKNRGIL